MRIYTLNVNGFRGAEMQPGEYVSPQDLQMNLHNFMTLIGDIRFEKLLGVEGQVQPSYQICQLFTTLQHSEELHQVAIIVVDDFSFRRPFSQEHLRTSHTCFHICFMGRHKGIYCCVDASFASSPREWAYRAGQCNQPPFVGRQLRIKQKQAVFVHTHANGLKVIYL